MQMKKLRKLSELVREDIDKLPEGVMHLEDVLALFHERGFGFLLFLFALPMALPIPVPPGINVILASPLLFLSMQMMIGREQIWLPKFVRRKEMQTKKFKTSLESALPWLKKIEVLLHARLSFMSTEFSIRFLGLFCLLMALCICIPIPLTNTVPSFAIALVSLGILSKDGISMLVGILIGAFWVSLLGWAVLAFGAEGTDVIKEWIKSCC